MNDHGICHETAAQVLVEDPEQPRLDLQPSDTLDHLNAASIRYRIAVGQGAGGKTLTLKNPALARTDSSPKPLRVPFLGFPVHPDTRTTTATTAVRSPSHPHG